MEVVARERGNNFIWCYRKDCIFYEKENQGMDDGGKFSNCKKEEVVIDRNGKCESEKIEEDNKFDMLREKEEYKDEVRLAGGEVE